MLDHESPNGGESGDPIGYLVADELPEVINDLIALLDCGALIEEEES